MKVTALAILALFGALGVALGMGYSGYGGYQYVAAYPAYGASAGGNNDTFLMLIGFLFLIMILFNGNLFNTNTSNSTTPPGVTVI